MRILALTSQLAMASGKEAERERESKRTCGHLLSGLGSDPERKRVALVLIRPRRWLDGSSSGSSLIFKILSPIAYSPHWQRSSSTPRSLRATPTAGGSWGSRSAATSSARTAARPHRAWRSAKQRRRHPPRHRRLPRRPPPWLRRSAATRPRHRRCRIRHARAAIRIILAPRARAHDEHRHRDARDEHHRAHHA